MPMLLKKQKRSSRKRSAGRSHPQSSVKALREQRLEAYKAMERLRRQMRSNEDGRFTKEQRQQWDRATQDFNQLSRQVRVAEQLRDARRAIEEIDDDPVSRHDYNGRREKRREERQPKITQETRNMALQSWFMTRSGCGDRLSREHRQACKLVGLNRHSNELQINMYRSHEVMAMQRAYKRFHPAIAGQHVDQMRSNFSANSPIDGGVLTMPTIVSSMESALLDYSGIMQVADIIVTDHGNQMSWPTANDTGNKGRRIGAGKTAASGATGIFKSLKWGAHKYTSDGLAIEQEEIEDAGFDLTNYIPTIGAERIARIFNDEATTGNGANCPDGIENCHVGHTTATTGTCVPVDIIKFLGKLESSYRQGAQLMMNDTIMTEVACMVDGQGNFIWRAGLEMGQPDRIRGYPVVPNVSMSNAIAAGNKIMAFGQMKHIKVRRVRSMRIYRERDNATDRELFYIYVRMDSKVLDAGTHPIILLKVKT